MKIKNYFRPTDDDVSINKKEINRIHKPHPNRYMKKLDCSNSLHGSVIGLIVLFISVANLSAFYGIKESRTGDENKDADSKKEILQSSRNINDESAEENISNVRSQMRFRFIYSY